MKLIYHPENGGSFDLPLTEPHTFAGEEFEPGKTKEVEKSWWNAYCVPGTEVFLMSRYGVLVPAPAEKAEDDEPDEDEAPKKRKTRLKDVEPIAIPPVLEKPMIETKDAPF